MSDYTNGEKLDRLAMCLAHLAVVLSRLSQSAGDATAAAVAINAYTCATAVNLGDERARAVRDAFVKEQTGISMAEIHDLKDQGLTTEEAYTILRKKESGNGN